MDTKKCAIGVCLQALAALVLMLGGCGDAAAPPSAPKNASGVKPLVGVLLYRADDTYVSMVGRTITSQLEGSVDFILKDAGNDQLTQDDQIAELLEKKAAALAVNLVDTKSAAHVVDKAKKAGIPVVFFNREPDLDIVKSYDGSRFVGSNVFDAGKMQGDLIAALWLAHPAYDRNKDGKIQYVMFQGNPDNPEALARTEYSVRRAKELGLDMRQVGETYVCDWEYQLARQAMQILLATRGAEVELVIANNDSMALGAIDALAEQGYNREGGAPDKFIPVVGVDATPQAVEAIRKGVMSATVKQDSEGMGQAVVRLLLNAANGKPFLDGTPYAWDESGVAIRIPYAPLSKE